MKRGPASFPDAACIGHTDLMFPERGNPHAVDRAKALCAICPALDQCREYVLSYNERWGVWGGLTDKDRRKLRAERRRAS